MEGQEHSAKGQRCTQVHDTCETCYSLVTSVYHTLVTQDVKAPKMTHRWVKNIVSHLARHVLRTGAHEVLVPGQEVLRQPLRIAALLMRLHP